MVDFSAVSGGKALMGGFSDQIDVIKRGWEPGG